MLEQTNPLKLLIAAFPPPRLAATFCFALILGITGVFQNLNVATAQNDSRTAHVKTWKIRVLRSLGVPVRG